MKKRPSTSIKKFSFRRFWKTIWNFSDSPATKAFSLAVGILIGLSPFYGLQTLLSIGAAFSFRLNKVITVGSSYISFPPLVPFIIVGQTALGNLLLGTSAAPVEDTSLGSIGRWMDAQWLPFLVGSFASAIVMATLSGFLLYGLLHFFSSRRRSEAGIKKHPETEQEPVPGRIE